MPIKTPLRFFGFIASIAAIALLGAATRANPAHPRFVVTYEDKKISGPEITRAATPTRACATIRCSRQRSWSASPRVRRETRT